MRLLLVDDQRAGSPESYHTLLCQMADQAGGQVVFLGSVSVKHDLLQEMRSRQPDALVIYEPAWPDGDLVHRLKELETCSFLVATSVERSERFESLAQVRPVVFVAAEAGIQQVKLGLRTLVGSKHREGAWQFQVANLQQRLNDRIVIERAKGILIQRLRLSEEDAYKRLRLSSRRQRRQIRDIAQSLLDTEALLAPDANGYSANGFLPSQESSPDTEMGHG